MAQATPSDLYEDLTILLKPPVDGYADSVASVLAANDHPFVVVGWFAQRWMGGTAVVLDGTLDICLRASQTEIIVHDLIESGQWIILDREGIEYAHRGSYDPDRIDLLSGEANYLLRRAIEWKSESPFSDIRIWTEERYNLKIDASTLVEVPDVYAYNHFMIETQYHPSLNRTDGWCPWTCWYGPRTLSRPGIAHCMPDTFARGRLLGNDWKVYIPTLPTYLDCLINHSLYYQSSFPELSSQGGWLRDVLVRDLFLELSHLSNILLPRVQWESAIFLHNRFARYRRTPRSGYEPELPENKFIHIKSEDPLTYPECRRLRFGMKRAAEIDSLELLNLV